MRRPLRLVAILAGILAFLAVSAALARLLAAGSAERGLTVRLIKTQARGDAVALRVTIDGCARRPACRARVASNVARLRTSAAVRILRLDGPPQLAWGPRTAPARIVWQGENGPVVVQCVRLRRAGDLLSGFRVRALGLSAPIAEEGSCADVRWASAGARGHAQAPGTGGGRDAAAGRPAGRAGAA